MNAEGSHRFSNLIRLCLGQFFAYIHAPALIFSIPILGYELAPNKNLATLPIALLTVAMVLSIPFNNRLMKKYGRRRGYLLGSTLVSLSSLGVFLALFFNSFVALTLAVMISGISGAFAQSYRFAVIEISDEARKGRNVSYLLLGGVAGGFSGPLIMNWFAGGIENHPFAASFLVLAGCGLLSFWVLSGLKFTKQPSINPTQPTSFAAFKINRHFLACAICGAATYGVMSLLMTATPVVMHHHQDFSLAQTAWVIQSHVVAMFLPSLFTGILIDKIGSRLVMAMGALILLFCSFSALSGVLFSHFWVALVCLGVGWNFLFVSATVAVSQTYHHTERFEAQSTNDIIVFSINALGALSSAWLLNSMGWENMHYLAISIIALISALIYFTTKKTNKTALSEVN